MHNERTPWNSVDSHDGIEWETSTHEFAQSHVGLPVQRADFAAAL